ncbi:MAG: hypothetical protein LBU65_08020 [Planctomycetaceae bacterium]|jgi:hypothetical protein|nr:hypothetical protein [Planctomycetaceae bacterium]
MALIQQVTVIVSSDATRWRSEIAASTDGVCEYDTCEILRWFSGQRLSKVMMSEVGFVLFHPLPSGRFAIAKTFPCRGEVLDVFKSESVCKVHLFIVPPETLLQFANNPVAVYRRLDELGYVKQHAELQPITLNDGGAMIDRELVNNALDTFGAESLVTLLQSTIDNVCTFFTTGFTNGGGHLNIIETIINLLPVNWRTELSFSSEFHFSLDEPFKLIGLSEPVAATGLPVCDLRNASLKMRQQSKPSSPHASSSWTNFVLNVLRRRDYESLETFLTCDFLRQDVLDTTLAGSGTNDLDLLGRQGLHYLKSQNAEFTKSLVSPMSGLPPIRHVKRATSRGKKFPRVESEITRIDSYTARAFLGDEWALTALRQLWQQMLKKLEQEERYELSGEYVGLTRDFMTAQQTRELRRTMLALNVLGVFLS